MSVCTNDELTRGEPGAVEPQVVCCVVPSSRSRLACVPGGTAAPNWSDSTLSNLQRLSVAWVALPTLAFYPLSAARAMEQTPNVDVNLLSRCVVGSGIVAFGAQGPEKKGRRGAKRRSRRVVSHLNGCRLSVKGVRLGRYSNCHVIKPSYTYERRVRPPGPGVFFGIDSRTATRIPSCCPTPPHLLSNSPHGSHQKRLPNRPTPAGQLSPQPHPPSVCVFATDV